MTVFMQKFNPPLRFSKEGYGQIQSIAEKLWCSENCNSQELSDCTDINYIGCMQIEEIWKHYYNEYYVSNYGYVVKIKPENKKIAEAVIPEELKMAYEDSAGYRWQDFSDELKKLFRENAFVPLNRKNSGCQICLNFTGNSSEYDLHKIIARFFLEKPEDFDEKKYVVHHLDNNSYNNSVVNLIYLPAETHNSVYHKIYHPMSHR